MPGFMWDKNSDKSFMWDREKKKAVVDYSPPAR